MYALALTIADIQAKIRGCDWRGTGFIFRYLAKIMGQTIIWGLFLTRFNSLLLSQKGYDREADRLSKKSNFVVFLDILGSIRQD